MLEDYEMNSPSIEAAAIPASANVGIEPTVEPNKPTGPVNQEAWYDIECGCYVLKDCPLPPLEKDDLASSVAQDNHPSLGLSQDASSRHSDGNTQCISQETGADGFPRRGVRITSMTVGKAYLNLRRISYRLSKSKRICRRQIFQTPHILTAPAPSRRAFK
jgi:hypothetical protein